jgi:hypothetical protein
MLVSDYDCAQPRGIEPGPGHATSRLFSGKPDIDKHPRLARFYIERIAGAAAAKYDQSHFAR